MEKNITNTIHNLTTYSFISLDQTESTFNDQITANIEYTDIKTNLNKNFVNNSSSIFKELTSTLPKFENQFLNETKNNSHSDIYLKTLELKINEDKKRNV